MKLCHEELSGFYQYTAVWFIMKFEKNSWDLWKTQFKFKASLVTSAGTAEGPFLSLPIACVACKRTELLKTEKRVVVVVVVVVIFPLFVTYFLAL